MTKHRIYSTPVVLKSIRHPRLQQPFHKNQTYLITSFDLFLVCGQVRIDKTNRGITQSESDSHTTLVTLRE